MNRYRCFSQIAIALALLVGILACNYPVASTVKTHSKDGLAPQPAKTLPQPTPSNTPTPLQTATPFPPPLPTQTPPALYQPTFEPAGCAFPVPPGTHPDCGYLMVPENRARPEGSMIRLHVAVFHSRSADPAPDPVVFLPGGPGSSALKLARYMFRQGLGGILADRDLILVDPRGTGFSEPELTCPEREEITPVLLEGRLSPDEKEQLIADAFRRCHDRLIARGIDLDAYNSAAIAADIEDLRLTLGYKQIDLYGISYGTRLALTVMRDFPQIVRSVVLDSTLPLQVNLYTSLAPNAERAFNVLFDRCSADPSCSAAYPNLKTVFYTLVDRLNADQVPVVLGSSGGKHRVLLDGGLLVDVLFSGLYNPYAVADMPKMIYEIRGGNTTILKERLGLYFEPSTALGMQMSLICSEELPFSSPEEAFTLAQGVQPQVAGFFTSSIQPLFAACRVWSPPTPDPRENQPVTSNIPALVLAGEFDPVTPPEWGRTAAASLSQAYFYEFPANGHWVTRSSPCALSITSAFLDNPATAPDAACISAIRELKFSR